MTSSLPTICSNHHTQGPYAFCFKKRSSYFAHRHFKEQTRPTLYRTMSSNSHQRQNSYTILAGDSSHGIESSELMSSHIADVASSTYNPPDSLELTRIFLNRTNHQRKTDLLTDASSFPEVYSTVGTILLVSPQLSIVMVVKS